MGACAGKPVATGDYPRKDSGSDKAQKNQLPALPDDDKRLVLSKATWTKTEHHTGSISDRYKVQSELGRGGFGAVNKVERLSDGMLLASKSCSQPTDRLLQEAELWEKVSTPYHDAVLQLVEIIRAPDGMHLLTEIMPYGELYDALDHIVFSEQACRMVTVQIASALAHLHLRHKIAHCDVKPANVLCRHRDPTVPGALKLSDYGFCQRFENRSVPTFTITCGTLDYFAPELAANHRNAKMRTGLVVKYGPAVDIWALGALVYELLHGEPPFFAPTDDELQLELIEKHELAFPAESFAQVSTIGKEFISGLLTADVAKRFYIEKALRHEWLQPVQDQSMREELNRTVPDAAVERRKAFVSERARRRLRVTALKVMAMRRLSGDGLSSDQMREALYALSNGGGSPGTDGGVNVVPPSSNALQELERQQREAAGGSDGPSPVRARRLSDTSTISYKSDEFGGRLI